MTIVPTPLPEGDYICLVKRQGAIWVEYHTYDTTADTYTLHRQARFDTLKEASAEATRWSGLYHCSVE